MLTKITGSISIFICSLALFLSAEILAEGFYDSLQINHLPTFAWLSNCVAPIGILKYIFPIALTAAYWLLKRGTKPNYPAIVYHFLIVIFSILFFSAVLGGSSQLILLDGHRPILISQIIGNIIIAAITISIIAFGVYRRKQHE
mgnify:FL=1